MTASGRQLPAEDVVNEAGCSTVSLRERLRADTASRHDQVDRAFSRLDLCERNSLVHFFQVQGAALRAVRCRPGIHAPDAEALRDEMIESIEADLRHLGATRPNEIDPVELDATAVLYVLLGSQMGLRVLRQRWAMATDPTVAGADRAFGLTSRTLAWRHFCNEVALRPAADHAADALVRDARRIFDLYLAAFRLAMTPTEVPSVSDRVGLPRAFRGTADSSFVRTLPLSRRRLPVPDQWCSEGETE